MRHYQTCLNVDAKNNHDSPIKFNYFVPQIFNKMKIANKKSLEQERKSNSSKEKKIINKPVKYHTEEESIRICAEIISNIVLKELNKDFEKR